MNAVPDRVTNDNAERALLDRLLDDTEPQPAPIFILGAPRTGSTVFYQAVCSRLGLPFIANLTNDCFAETPIVGLAIQKSLPERVCFDSDYGKTKGAMQPSEASAVMTRWFGGGHPSAIVSARVCDGAERHFLATLGAAETLFGAPLVIKNAWNCFRVEYLASALPRARFLWLRRDIAAAAKSDLAARYRTKHSACGWNSATPANIAELQRLPPPAQVVENQYEYNRAIGRALSGFADARWRGFWYEDFLADPDRTLAEVGTFLGQQPLDSVEPIEIRAAGTWTLPPADEHAVDEYLAAHRERLADGRRDGVPPEAE